MKYTARFRSILYRIVDYMELSVTLIVAAGTIIAIIMAFMAIPDYWANRHTDTAFTEFITLVFSVIIGIEFLKLLCRPHTGNIIETLIFLLARRMIGTNITPQEDLIVVICICILFFFRRFMLATKPGDDDDVENFMRLFGRNSNPPNTPQ